MLLILALYGVYIGQLGGLPMPGVGTRINPQMELAPVNGSTIPAGGVSAPFVRPFVPSDRVFSNTGNESNSSNTNSSNLKVPGRVQSRINITNDGWKHVLDRHFSAKNASQFTVTQKELRELLSSENVIKTPITKIMSSKDGFRYVREVFLNKSIGLDKYNGFQPTNTRTIMTDEFGNLKTTTPGLIK